MNLKIGQKFPDIELPDHENQPVKLSELVGKFPFILTFYRGYWWAKCQVQLRHYVELQKELAVNYCHLAVCSVDSPDVNDAFRTGLGAQFPFLSDQDRKVVKMLDMTETSKSMGVTAMPHTFSLMPDLTIHNIYNGYWYLGRPTLDELRADLRAMLRKVRPDFEGPVG